MSEQKAKHILVVDDEQSIRDLLREILEEEGFLVTTAKNGIEAFEFVSQGNVIDLIITDVRMPGMGGVLLLEKVKETNPFVPPVIFITGYSDINAEDAFSKGATAYLKKPMSIDEILKVVHGIFSGPPRFMRKYYRVDVRLQVKFAIKEHSDLASAKAVNISQGGVFIATDVEANIGDIIEFELFFNEGKPQLFSGIGEVVWRRTEAQGSFLPGIGIKFINIPPEVEEFIAKYVEEKKTLTFIPKS